MIKQLRVDDRLIHGQVALMWSKALSTKGIIVANDGAAADPTIASTLKMACPEDQHLLIRSVKDAKGVLNDPRSETMPIFVLTNCVADALELVKACPNVIKEVNIANVGRFVHSQKVQVLTSVEMTPEEIVATRELCKFDIPVFHQVTPSDEKTDMVKVLSTMSE